MSNPTPLSRALATLTLAAALGAQACSSSPARGEPDAPESSGAEATPATRVVVLGDSIPTTNGCPGCTGFPDLYGRAIARRDGSDVDVNNLARPGAGVADLVTQVQEDPTTRQALGTADVVVVTIGFNDTPWGRGDDPCHIAPDFPTVLWGQITDDCIDRVTADYSRGLGTVLSTLDQVAPKDAALRVVGVYNSVIGDYVDPGWDSPEAVEPSIQANAAFVDVQRIAAEKHGGKFVDMLTRMNGPLGRKAAGKYLATDYTHLNQRGHELTARALTQSGWED